MDEVHKRALIQCQPKIVSDLLYENEFLDQLSKQEIKISFWRRQEQYNFKGKRFKVLYATSSCVLLLNGLNIFKCVANFIVCVIIA
jgi:hypothetical protein